MLRKPLKIRRVRPVIPIGGEKIPVERVKHDQNGFHAVVPSGYGLFGKIMSPEFSAFYEKSLEGFLFLRYITV